MMSIMENAPMKWADAQDDIDEDFDNDRFESAVDKDGIKTVTEYEERGKTTFKVTRKMKVTLINKRINLNAAARKNMNKFGIEKIDKGDTRRIEDEINIEPVKRNLGVAQDELDKFLDQEVQLQLGKKREQGGVWTAGFRNRDGPENAPEVTIETDANNRDQSGKYVPPSLRGGRGINSRLDEQKQREDYTLRVTNLSEDVREGDLTELFGQFGKLWRVYLAKNPETKESKGFAFVTYCSRSDAEKAISKLHGHGYDNLILNVAFARPRQP